MKKIISILLILVIISCKGEKATINNENNYFLEFIQQTDQYIYLYKIDRNNPLKIDSSKSNKGIHQFNISCCYFWISPHFYNFSIGLY